MIDRVVFAAVRWGVSDPNRDSQDAGNFMQSFSIEWYSVAIAATAASQMESPTRPRVAELAQPMPPPANGICSQFSRVRASRQINERFVRYCVINALRYGLLFATVRSEIMVKGMEKTVGPSLPTAGKTSNEFLLFRVNA